ncbi:Galactosylgalactosylxylosylprotein 3-beta-glucuronosyltransferase 2 [Taenia solium]
MRLFQKLVIVLILAGAFILVVRRPQCPTIFVITPTYSRPNQKPDLVRLCTVLGIAKGVHWIVVEDAMERSRIDSISLRMRFALHSLKCPDVTTHD